MNDKPYAVWVKMNDDYIMESFEDKASVNAFLDSTRDMRDETFVFKKGKLLKNYEGRLKCTR